MTIQDLDGFYLWKVNSKLFITFIIGLIKSKINLINEFIKFQQIMVLDLTTKNLNIFLLTWKYSINTLYPTFHNKMMGLSNLIVQ